MKAFLLAAGLGTRLRSLTDEIPKCLLPIGGKPLLEIWLELLGRHGVDHILINTHHHAEKVEEYVKNRNQWSEVRSQKKDERENRKEELEGTLWPKVRLFYEEELLGSGGTVYGNRAFVEGEEAFWVIYADNLSSVNLKRMHEAHKRHGELATIGLFEPENPRECGIALLDETGRVVGFEEKPARPKGNLANAGIYLLSKDIFEQVRWDFPLPMDFGFHILPQLVGQMYGYPINAYHLDIGTPENYQRAQREYQGEDRLD